MDVAGRVPRLRAGLEEAGCDAALITRVVNVRYLSGFTGSAGMLLVLPDELHFVTDGRYGDQAAEELGRAGVDAAVHVGRTMPEQRSHVVERVRAIARLGLEAEAVTWAQHRRFVTEWFPELELVPTEDLVEGLRRVKDDGEVDRMAAAAAVGDGALATCRSMLAEGVTEADFAVALDFDMRRGSDGPSFETIVASGPNGAKPHHRPTDRRIEAGELVVVDFGAQVDGYCSDMTRTFSVGEPSPTARRMAEVVTQSQQAGVAAVAGGVRAQAVDEACRSVIQDAGWADAFLHSTGHGVGLEIHEAPRVASTSTDILEPGYVVTVEPGVYLPEHGGVRIEDTVVVTSEGCRALTNAPKDLILT
ncbi:MAG TPA: Xaa-Pro peptidase family protein [Acidimicrobiales bacterium]|nr:Xaa-Pro peptidase family protein [Acidimicrobiales bacterium]